MTSSNDSPFQIQPPAMIVQTNELQQSLGQSFVPQGQDEAWMKYIIEYNIPEQEKAEIINMLRPLMNLAPRSNIRRSAVCMHLFSYDLIWDKYFIYVKKGKYDQKLLVLEESLREAFELQLDRSVEGWLGKLMHTKLFRIFQTSEDRNNVARKVSWLRGGNKKQDNNQGE